MMGTTPADPPSSDPAAAEARGRALLRAGMPAEAAEAAADAVARAPGWLAAHDLLANACLAAGDAPRLFAALREVVARFPDHAAAGSALLYALHYLPGLRPADVFAAHRAWAARHADPLTAAAGGRFANRPDPGRRLRVGYVAAGFRDHPVARFQLAALEHRDRSRFDVVCYSDAPVPDATTARLRGLADRWRDTAGWTDAQLATQVRADGVDVLVDLHGHSPQNRLLAFARRPAPVQATYNGYVDTTGMAAMGWRVTDGWHDPPGATDAYHTEKLWRLPGGNWCYAPDPEDHEVLVGPPPALDNGRVTFGCLNHLAKASGPCLRLWGRVLASVPGSRLVLRFDGDPAAGGPAVLRRLEAEGLPAGRVDLVPAARPRGRYLGLFAGVDVCLDPVPFNGITTTCDALWMGVPLVSLAGQSHVSRAGVSILTAVGLSELIAADEDEYMRIAAELAADLPRLAALRAGLRARMAASALCVGPRLARELEAAYRGMWRAWCRGTG